MSQTYTIREVSERTRDWETKDGKSKNRSYYVKCEGDEKLYELAQKRDREPPKAGDTLDAKVETREHEGTTYYKLVREYQQGGRGGGGKSPSEQRRIAMQASQKVAVDIVTASVASQGKPLGVDSFTDVVVTAAKRLFDQVESVA